MSDYLDTPCDIDAMYALTNKHQLKRAVALEKPKIKVFPNLFSFRNEILNEYKAHVCIHISYMIKTVRL